MLLILGLFAGCLVGFMLCAVLGAGKVCDLETDNAYYRDMCICLRAKLALLEMGEEIPEKGRIMNVSGEWKPFPENIPVKEEK